MPYIRIKAYPKDEAVKQKVAEAINKVFLDNWGCAPEAVSISFEEVAPELWEQQVENGEIESLRDKMFILHGDKNY
jgi:4-oxalocrotonate tautomerase